MRNPRSAGASLYFPMQRILRMIPSNRARHRAGSLVGIRSRIAWNNHRYALMQAAHACGVHAKAEAGSIAGLR